MRNKKVAELDKRAREASELLAAMANEKRLMILCHLLDGETSVNELADLVAMNQSALSQQLSKLRALKLVDTRRDAQQVYYRLASEEVERILQTLYGIYCDPETKTAKAKRG
ncbi:metalloregulator ArsR/SmtB family transcription factor [Mesorhizobium sp. B2-1-8]|uniref:ArsR/SmtB family transcription factor n=1 Tax=unclassified Mesorhizobium TaxID=325217 RepID=UPI001126098E|nr:MULTISPECIES: metalloregulator ArsR/SmtB family transcription factor [unclassified Mesorhizobium]MBZ9672300.1 metalloregulator ArsR/SmtB family transcription factor [Mesorhizobium sp. ES1-3]MBZ9706193.1 metalloregulator ArsR/SmtB family transcription factor [Mesorhizobium sp. ESP7-2]TPI24291.1 winged helix-turn-helix transcriptional regulator [Mesorhizobium sp. B3-2-1]UCI21673.1 metalloregulator ArsR/SmtB family transcription factor [Mesorhizobium sp. B2-1-8]